jgi:hypothetical protein
MMPPESWIVFFEWCEATFLGTTVRNSIWLFPVIEATHLVALCVMGGTLILVDLRLLGLGLKEQTVAELSGHVRPWLLAAVTVMLSTGVLLFLAEAIKCFYNTSFWVKMITLPVALLFTFLVKERAVAGGLTPPMRSRLLGAVSLALWFTVAAAGRWIGYS